AREEVLELAGDVAQARAGGMADDVDFRRQIGGDFHACLFAPGNHLSDVASDFVRIDVDGGDEPYPRFGEQKARDLRSDRTDAVLRNVDGLLHSGGGLYARACHPELRDTPLIRASRTFSRREKALDET